MPLPDFTRWIIWSEIQTGKSKSAEAAATVTEAADDVEDLIGEEAKLGIRKPEAANQTGW